MSVRERTKVNRQLAALRQMGAGELGERYQQVFGDPTRSGNRDVLFKRIAWRVQSLAEGGLSERAKRRAEELARDADLRTTMPKPPRVTNGAVLKFMSGGGGDKSRAGYTARVVVVTDTDGLDTPGAARG
jgi:hypothetical protein